MSYWLLVLAITNVSLYLSGFKVKYQHGDPLYLTLLAMFSHENLAHVLVNAIGFVLLYLAKLEVSITQMLCGIVVNVISYWITGIHLIGRMREPTIVGASCLVYFLIGLLYSQNPSLTIPSLIGIATSFHWFLLFVVIGELITHLPAGIIPIPHLLPLVIGMMWHMII